MKTVGILVLISAALIYGLLRFLRNVQPDDQEVEEDLIELKEKIAAFKGGLADWDSGLSSNEVNQIMTKSNQRSGDGVFLSDNGDPVFAYAFKKYIGPGENAVMYAMTHTDEYVFRITNKGTTVQVNGQSVGLIRDNERFFDQKNDLKARLVRNNIKNTSKIFIGDIEAGKIALPKSNMIQAFEMNESTQSNEDVSVAKTLAIYQLIYSISETD